MFYYILVVVFCLVHLSCGWVFTDVKFPSRESSEMWNSEDEIPPEELQRLLIEERLSLTYIGTKWCGPGNTAADDNDIGSSQEADLCCREHDMCPDIMSAGESKYNLTNNAYYTRLNCMCDEKFRSCLRAANTKTATQVGVIYFDGLNTKCYREDFPVTGCAKKSGWLIKKCVRYTYDVTAPRRYQWFDVPDY